MEKKEGNAQSSPWDMWISPKLFLEQLRNWINGNLVSGEVRKLLLSIVKRELWDIMLSWFVAISIFYIVCCEAVARGRFKQSIKMCGRPKHKTEVKFTYPGQHLNIPSLSLYCLLLFFRTCAHKTDI